MAGLTLFLLALNIPLYITFFASKSDLDALVRDASAGNTHDRQAGWFPAAKITPAHDGSVTFLVPRTGFLSNGGFEYIPPETTRDRYHDDILFYTDPRGGKWYIIYRSNYD